MWGLPELVGPYIRNGPTYYFLFPPPIPKRAPAKGVGNQHTWEEFGVSPHQAKEPALPCQFSKLQGYIQGTGKVDDPTPLRIRGMMKTGQGPYPVSMVGWVGRQNGRAAGGKLKGKQT